MNRCLYVLIALLIACNASAAPALKPFVNGWGNPIDSDKDCKIRRNSGVLTMEMPGSVHEYDVYRKHLNSPRLLREFEGDFEMQIRVRIDCRPSAESSDKSQPSYVSAGFLIIPPENTGRAFIRLEYRAPGQGEQAYGCAACLAHDREGGGETSILPLKFRNSPFSRKPDHVYLRLVRWGYLLDSSISPDGKTWLRAGGCALAEPPSKLTVGLAACTTSSDPSKVVFDQLTITRGKKRKPWEFVSGWGKPIDPDKDCKIQREKDALTIEMPGSDHDYDPVRKRFNAPRIISDLKGVFDLQVRLRIDYRLSAQSTVKGQPAFVSAGFLLIYPDGLGSAHSWFACNRLDFALSQQGFKPDVYRVAPLLAKPRRKNPVPKSIDADNYAVMKTWNGDDEPKVTDRTVEWDRGQVCLSCTYLWERGWSNWPLPEKPEYAYLRLDHREGWSCFYISPDGQKWTRLRYLRSLPAKGKLALAAYSTSTEPSKVRFDQLKLWRRKKNQ